MTTSIDELCKILKAYEEGKTIEVYAPDSAWYETNLGAWRLCEMLKQKLRIKPEPREFWGVIYPDGSINSFETKELAEEFMANSEWAADVVHFREVLENE